MEVAKASGKLGILVPGMGAVGTTFIAGVYAINKGLSKPIGALSQMGGTYLMTMFTNPLCMLKC